MKEVSLRHITLWVAMLSFIIVVLVCMLLVIINSDTETFL